jgi:hypothetical protein
MAFSCDEISKMDNNSWLLSIVCNAKLSKDFDFDIFGLNV